MIKFTRLSHINIVVDDMAKAIRFYHDIFQAEPVMQFPHFQNDGFALSAGFVEEPEEVDVSISFLTLPTSDELTLELMEYHSPAGHPYITQKKTNDLGGPRHIAVGVSNAEEAFEWVKSNPLIQLISDAPEYRPLLIDPIQSHEFLFFNDDWNDNEEAKQGVCDMIAQIKYFYFIDPYGVQWELEEKPCYP